MARKFTLSRWGGAFLAVALLQPCAAQAETTQAVLSAFVALGENGQPVARVITSADTCPTLTLDTRQVPMHLRAGPSTEPQRPTASAPDLSKPSAFPVRVCDLPVLAGTHRVTLGDRKLPLPPRHINRIVVIGDTGCRLKAKDDAWQACNDPDQYPFAQIAAKAAAWKPDLVVHVGDYLYRENPCPGSHSGCAESPWGYGWDSWNADFFGPGEALLAAAPWALSRGNHENCARAGQGWWRLLDPRPLVAGRDCNDPASDVTGDYSPPYAIPLGKGAQIVIMDLSHAGTDKIDPNDPRAPQYRETARMLAQMSSGKIFTFAVDHYPFLGIAAKTRANGTVKLMPGNKALQPLFAEVNRSMMPKGVDVLLAGHIHLWEQVDFAGRQPSQFVAGFSGTQEDVVPMPRKLPAGVTPTPGTPVHGFDAIVASFGFMTLERSGRRSWRANVFDKDGELMHQCSIEGRRSHCWLPAK